MLLLISNDNFSGYVAFELQHVVKRHSTPGCTEPESKQYASYKLKRKQDVQIQQHQHTQTKQL